MKIQVLHQFAVRRMDGTPLTAAELHGEGERLMAALLDLEQCNPDVRDSTTSTDADQGTVVVELAVEAGDEVEAVRKSGAITRTAIHAIGGATPWDAGTTADYRPQNVQLEYV